MIHSHIYVDKPVQYITDVINPAARKHGKVWCHLWCDVGFEEDLHVLAKKLGMKLIWFQDKRGFPHYDIVVSKRGKAIEYGAQEMDLKVWLKQRVHGGS